MSAPQDKSTEELRAQEEEVRETKEAENLNENAEEETELENNFADLQITNEKPEDETMGEIPLSEAQRFRVNVTFNEKDEEMCDDLSKGRDKFTKTKKNILRWQSSSRGPIYFEVDVKGKKFWGVGVAEDYGERTGEIKVNPENGFWMISRRRGNTITVHEDGSKDRREINYEFNKVGVFVDFDKGLVIFYIVDKSAHIHTFRGKRFHKLLLLYLEIPYDD